MKLYFGNITTTVTTILLLGVLGFIGSSVRHRADIPFWGRRSLFLACCGLVLCCFAAARDGLDKTIQCAIDGSCAPGIFSLISVPNGIGCIGAAIITAAGIAALVSKTQHARELWFYLMSGGVLLKIGTVEIARILL